MPFFAFFGTAIGKVALIGLAFLFLSGMITAAYYQNNRLVEQRALAEFNKQQYEKVLEEKNRFEKQTIDLQKKADQIALDLEKSRDELNNKSREIEDLIAKSKDEDAAAILKETIRRLQGNK